MISRRTFFFSSAGVIASATGVGVYTRFLEPRWLEVTQRRMPIRGLPAALEGKTLVQVSDIHVSDVVPDEFVRSTFATVRAFKPDFIAYTGDFSSHHGGRYEHALDIYRDMPRGTLGTYASLGNHDYGREWNSPADAARISEILTAQGVTVLVNETAETHGLQIVGLGDLWGRVFDPRAGFANLAPNAPAVVLSHNPDTVDLAGWEPFNGWILAGHTHGGQCKPPFLPPPILPVKNKRYTSGVFALPNGRTMYISRGVGTWLPVRFNVRPEVTVFTLATG